MARTHYETRAELERRLKAARQLRSETVAGVARDLLARAAQAIQRMLAWIDLHGWRQT